MSILVGSTWIFAVIDVEGSNLIFAENMVKGINYTVKIVDNVISGIVSVAGIKADPETVFFHHTIIDLSQFFKSASDLSAFSGHGFRATRQLVSSVSTSFSPLTTDAIPASTPAPTCAPG